MTKETDVTKVGETRKQEKEGEKRNAFGASNHRDPAKNKKELNKLGKGYRKSSRINKNHRSQKLCIK